jgi:hypothetical protein
VLVREPISYYSTNSFLNTQLIFCIIISMVTIVAIINMGTIVSIVAFIKITAMLTIIHVRGIVRITTILIIGIF